MTLPDAVALSIARGQFPEGDTYKVALYTVALTGVTAQAYSVTNETSGTGYTAGGFTLAVGAFNPNFWGLVTTTAIFDPADTQSGTGSTFTFQSILVYNDTDAGDVGLYFFNAGGDQVVSNGQLTIIWPTPDAANGLVRVPQ